MEILIAFIIVLIIGRKKPFISAILGCAAVIGLYLYFNKFEFKLFFSEIWIGCAISLIGSFLMYYLWSGVKGGKHNTGPSFMAGPGGLGGGAPPGGIILSDEERKKHKRR